MLFHLMAKTELNIDGQVIEPGNVVGTFQTDCEISSVISAVYHGDLKIVSNGRQTPREEVRHVRREHGQKVDSQTPNDDTAENLENIDPDALNAQPDADTEPSSAPNGSGELDDTKAPEASTELPGEFRGLSERIATALCDAGFSDRQSVAKYYEENGGFAEIVGIGKAAERKIVAWLEG